MILTKKEKTASELGDSEIGANELGANELGASELYYVLSIAEKSIWSSFK